MFDPPSNKVTCGNHNTQILSPLNNNEISLGVLEHYSCSQMKTKQSTKLLGINIGKASKTYSNFI